MPPNSIDMTTSTHDPEDDAQWTREADDRYAELQVQENDVMIYDLRNHSAWLSSNAAVLLSKMV